MEYRMAKFNEMNRLFEMKHVRKVVMKLQGDRNEKDRIFLSMLRFTHYRENVNWHVRFPVILVPWKSKENILCSLRSFGKYFHELPPRVISLLVVKFNFVHYDLKRCGRYGKKYVIPNIRSPMLVLGKDKVFIYKLRIIKYKCIGSPMLTLGNRKRGWGRKGTVADLDCGPGL